MRFFFKQVFLKKTSILCARITQDEAHKQHASAPTAGPAPVTESTNTYRVADPGSLAQPLAVSRQVAPPALYNITGLSLSLYLFLSLSRSLSLSLSLSLSRSPAIETDIAA